jgi:hypothetical protein
LDPFGLPLSEEALSMDGEFDLEQLEPKTRSVGAVLVPPPPLRRLGDGPFGAVQGVMGVQAYKPQQLVGSGAFAGVTKEHMARLDAKAPLPTAGSLAPSVTAGVKAAMRHDAGAYAAVPPALPMEEEGGVVADAAPRPVVVPEPPLLPFDISVFPIERCHFFTEKEPAVSALVLLRDHEGQHPALARAHNIINGRAILQDMPVGVSLHRLAWPLWLRVIPSAHRGPPLATYRHYTPR